MSVVFFLTARTAKVYAKTAKLKAIINYECVELSSFPSTLRHSTVFSSFFFLSFVYSSFNKKKRPFSSNGLFWYAKKQVLCLFNFFVVYILNIVTLRFLWLRFSLLTLFSLSVHCFCSNFPCSIDIV